MQDPSNKRKIILDDKLSTIFTAPVDMFSMNKQLSRHCKTNGEDQLVFLCWQLPVSAATGLQTNPIRKLDSVEVTVLVLLGLLLLPCKS